MRRYALRDDQWDRIKDLLPGREGHVGVTAKDNRLFVEAVLYRYRAGIPWRDLPERFGDPETIHTRFSRWAKSGVWEAVFKHLSDDADNEYAMIDSTIVLPPIRFPGALDLPVIEGDPPCLGRLADGWDCNRGGRDRGGPRRATAAAEQEAARRAGSVGGHGLGRARRQPDGTGHSAAARR